MHFSGTSAAALIVADSSSFFGTACMLQPLQHHAAHLGLLESVTRSFHKLFRCLQLVL
jgi:hypothetical protein